MGREGTDPTLGTRGHCETENKERPRAKKETDCIFILWGEKMELKLARALKVAKNLDSHCASSRRI